jgi:RNA polymerase sigma-70 factor (ECF subfamily)
VSVPTFESLLTPVLAPAYRVAANLVGDVVEAEDVVQEAALRAFRAFGTFTPGTNFRAWFLKIVTNCSLGRLRQRRTRPLALDFDELPDLYLYQKTKDLGLHTEVEDPAGALLQRLDIEQIMQAIGALPEEYRVVATLYFVEDLSYEEIAEAVACPIGTVRSRLHRGRKMLQKALWKTAEDAGIVGALTGGTRG